MGRKTKKKVNHQKGVHFREKWIIGVFVFWALFLSFEFWGFGSSSYVKIPDSANGNMAARLAIGKNIEENENGYWNSDLWAGTDRKAQSDSLGIFNLVFLISPGWLGNGLFAFIQRFVAGFFTYKILNKHLKLSVMASLIPALFYSLFSQNQINLQFDGFTNYDGLGLPGIPLYLFVLSNLSSSEQLSIKNLIFAFILGVCFADVSQYKYMIFFFPLLFFWLMFINPKRRLISFWLFISFCLGWFALEIFEISSAFFILGMSQRTLRNSCFGVMGSGKPFGLLYLVSRMIWVPGNIPAIILGLQGIVFWQRSKNYRNNIFVGLLLIFYVACSFYIPSWICSPENPFGRFKGFNYSRFYIFVPFLAAVFSGTGLQTAIDFVSSKLANTRIKVNVLISIAFGILAFSIFWLGINVKQRTFQERLGGSNYSNVFMNPYLQFLSDYSENVGGHYRAVTVRGENEAFPPEPAYLWPYGLNTIDGYSALFTHRFLEYWQMVINPMMRVYPKCRYGLKLREGNSRIGLIVACDIGAEIDFSHFTNLFNLDLLSLSGTRFVVSSRPLSTPRLIPIDTSSVNCPSSIPGCTKYYLYENPDAFPFVFTLGEIQSFPNNGKLIERLGMMDVALLSKRGLVNDQEVFNLPIDQIGDLPASINLIKYSSDAVKLEFSSEQPKIAVLNYSYVPSWTAWIDGREVPVFPVDNFLIGVYVPSGDHSITFQYLPNYSFLGIFHHLFKEKYSELFIN